MSSADMTKVAMIKIYEDEVMRSIGAELAIAVHDELIIEVAKEHQEVAQKRLETLMVEAAEEKITGVPFKVEGLIMDRWVKD